MKQYLIALALLLSLNAGQATAARKSAHRRHQALTEQAARQGKPTRPTRQKPTRKALRPTAIRHRWQVLRTVWCSPLPYIITAQR